MNKLLFFFYDNKYFFLFFLVVYSIYCSIKIGISWDMPDHFLLGKSVFNYLFSFGKIDNHVYYREYYSPIYWSFVYFVSLIFNKSFNFTIFKLINLIIGWLSLIGFYKLTKIVFNKDIGIISFIFLFFFPIFFGHFSINPKDTFLAFSHIWIFYYLLEYLKNQKKNYKIIYRVSLLISISTGIQLYFIGSLIPIFIFFFFLILKKKIINTNFSYKIFLIDLLKIVLISYLILILFWVDTHNNIFFEPFKLILQSFDTVRGWQSNLLNGNIFYSSNAPIYYVYISLLFKLPEYLIILYCLFIFLIFKIKKFFEKEIYNFNYFLFFFLILLFYPLIILKINPFSVYDGLRLYIWFLPYTIIMPSLVFYYLIKNISKIKKIILNIIIGLFIINIFIFFLYTPYQYTYTNALLYLNKNKDVKFETDYWGTSIKELIENIKTKKIFSLNENVKVFNCGAPYQVIKYYLKKNNINNIVFKDYNESDYILLTNRTVVLEINKNKELYKCINFVKKEINSINRLNKKLTLFGELKK